MAKAQKDKLRITNAEECAAICEHILDGTYASGFVGPRALIKKVIVAMITGGHVLFEDAPGLGKTMLAKVITGVTNCDYKRVQFTPDLLPSDILGVKVWRPKEDEFEFLPGPIFTSLLLADEINRAPPKTQAALLEAMGEGQVTIEGETFPLKEPFLVMATQNPIEQQGTYPLPEAQLDRFAFRLSIGYPQSATAEVKALNNRIERLSDDPTVGVLKCASPDELLALRWSVENNVFIDSVIVEYIVNIARKTREHQRLAVGCSLRGAVSLMQSARGVALFNGRDFVIPDDVKEIVTDALAHRVVATPQAYFDGTSNALTIEEVVQQIPAPTANQLRGKT